MWGGFASREAVPISQEMYEQLKARRQSESCYKHPGTCVSPGLMTMANWKGMLMIKNGR